MDSKTIKSIVERAVNKLQLDSKERQALITSIVSEVKSYIEVEGETLVITK